MAAVDLSGRDNAPDNAWEQTLDAILAHDRPARSEKAIGLQFEVVTEPRSRQFTTRTWSMPSVRVGVRPVTEGVKGGWIKSGVSWNDLRFQRAGKSTHAQFVDEIAQLGNAASAYYYGRSDGLIYLDDLSRRIWSVLAEAQAAGLPMIDTSRDRRRVHVSTEPAELSLDATRNDTGLHLTPRIAIGEVVVDPRVGALIGDPAHGVATFPTVDGVESLLLAAFEPPLTQQQQAAATRGVLRIPPTAERRFLGDFYPRLRQSVVLGSSDGSVVLPEPERPTLRLTVRTDAKQLIHLSWQWAYRLGDTERVEPLHPRQGDAAVRDDTAESAVLAEVATVPVVGSMWTVGRGGRRLASTASLGQAETIAFGRDVLPALREMCTWRSTRRCSPTTARRAEPVIRSRPTAPARATTGSTSASRSSSTARSPVRRSCSSRSPRASRTCCCPTARTSRWTSRSSLQLARLIEEARALQDRPGRPRCGSAGSRPGCGRSSPPSAVSRQAGRAWQQQVSGLLDRRDRGRAECRRRPADARRCGPYQLAGFDWLAFLLATPARRHPRRRHGPRQDAADAGADLPRAGSRTPDVAPFLVVAPTSVVPTGRPRRRGSRPACRWSRSPTRSAGAAPTWPRSIAGADVVVTSYTLFRLDFEDYEALDWAGLILDEAQFVKNHQSKAYQCAQRLAGAVQARDHRHADGEQPDGAVVAAVDHRARPVPGPGAVHASTTARPIEQRRQRRAAGPAAPPDPAADAAAHQGAGGRRPAGRSRSRSSSSTCTRGTARSTRPTCSGSGRRCSACSTTSTATGSTILRSLTLLRQLSLRRRPGRREVRGRAVGQARRADRAARRDVVAAGTGRWCSASSPGSWAAPGTGWTRPGSTTATSTARPATGPR